MNFLNTLFSLFNLGLTTIFIWSWCGTGIFKITAKWAHEYKFRDHKSLENYRLTSDLFLYYPAIVGFPILMVLIFKL